MYWSDLHRTRKKVQPASSSCTMPLSPHGAVMPPRAASGRPSALNTEMRIPVFSKMVLIALRISAFMVSYSPRII